MTDMGALAEYFGFTDDEVREICVTDMIWTLKRQGHGTMDISS